MLASLELEASSVTTGAGYSAVFQEFVLESENIDAAAAPTKRTVAIAVDASQYARHAVHWAIDNYLRPDDLVAFINVRTQVIIPAVGLNGDTSLEYAELAEKGHLEDSKLLLGSFMKLVSQKGFVSKGYSVGGFQQRKHAIVEKCAQLNAHVLICASRGVNAVSRALLGSVSDYCAHHCACPVVVVRPTRNELDAMTVPEHHKYPEAISVPPSAAVNKI
ncbi:hypothetical protein BJ741DRAFT_614543 [Chytriomyces cf. hyalinus JEL632]|nr:hypothetical protein BJ741DRAFT_614543 [Chytriomyces cf. hyalinus JEL632]